MVNAIISSMSLRKGAVYTEVPWNNLEKSQICIWQNGRLGESVSLLNPLVDLEEKGFCGHVKIRIDKANSKHFTLKGTVDQK